MMSLIFATPRLMSDAPKGKEPKLNEVSTFNVFHEKNTAPSTSGWLLDQIISEIRS